jgi:pimeloyl-ACP methyl ester carboxylesterase
LNQSTVIIEGLTVHFIHERSSNPDSIPLILNHGWPGSFLEFVPIIQELTKNGTTSKGKLVSFHVVIPSLPGFAFSSPPPENWTAEGDTARIFNSLMVEVLGYETYAAFGTDWGSAPAYGMYKTFNTSCRAGHFAFLPFLPPSFDQLAAMNITLNSLELIEESITVAWSNTGSSYFTEQTTKPNTIGLALYDNPVGQLAWIGEKYLNCGFILSKLAPLSSADCDRVRPACRYRSLCSHSP